MAPHLRVTTPPARSPSSLSRVRRFYSERWQRGQQLRDRLWRSWWQPAYDQMLRWAGPLAGRRVVVLFAGLGEDAVELTAAGADVIGIDFALPALQHATRAVHTRPGPAYVCADAGALPLASRSFDIVFVINGICHTDKERVLAESRRVLRPGGRVFLLEALRYPHVAVVARFLEPYMWFAPHRFLSVRELNRLALGFDRARHRQFFVLSVLSAMLLRLPFGPRVFQPLHRWLAGLDHRLLQIAPFLRHVSYLTVAELQAGPDGGGAS